jgi:hypothetical protein
MRPDELFEKTQSELERLAAERGLTTAADAPRHRLIQSILEATSPAEGHIWTSTLHEPLTQSGKPEHFVIRNLGKGPVELELELVGDTRAFRIPAQELKFVVEGGEGRSVPVEFGIAEPPKGYGAFTRSRVYNAAVRIWDTATGAQVATTRISGLGVGYVDREEVSCMIEPTPRTEAPVHHSPPDVRVAVSPETAAPGGTVRVEWTTSGADHVWEYSGGPGMTVLEDGTFTDMGLDGSERRERTRAFDFTMGWRSHTWEVDAINADGQTRAEATVYLEIPLGYHNARLAIDTIERRILTQIRGYLEEIERRLRAGCIRNNRALDSFGDAYLRDGLTDDILTRMQDVVIHIGTWTIPSMYTNARDLCLCRTPGEQCCVFGKTPGDRSWISVCLSCGADALTLLHELYHYSAGHDFGNEDKAFAISDGAAGCFS